MRDSYLIPCGCGREIPVEATQSGQEITCQCGQRLEVPTMRKLRTLQRVKRVGEAKRPAATWGARQAVLLLGAIITLGGLAWAAYLYYFLQPRILKIEDLTPFQSWVAWQEELRPGLRQPPPWEKPYLKGMKDFGRWLVVSQAVIGLGVVVMLSSVVIPKKGPARRKTPGPRGAKQRAPGRR